MSHKILSSLILSIFILLSLFHFIFFFFFFNDTATTEIYTLSLHDALPISRLIRQEPDRSRQLPEASAATHERSEEHTSELQSRQYLVCRLLLEKKKRMINEINRRVNQQNVKIVL